MEDSILDDVKKLLGITSDYTAFDAEIIMYINSVILILSQLGVGKDSLFRITDSSSTWGDYLSEEDDIEAIKTYMGMKVKLMFDPPSGGTAMEALKSVCSEFEWRINVQVDKYEHQKEVEYGSDDE